MNATVKSLFFLGIAFLVGNIANSQSEGWQRKVDASLLIKTDRNEMVDFIVIMQQQADVSAAQKLQLKEEKGRFVFNTLQKTAQQSQSSVLAILQKAQAFYRSFSIVNAVWVRGNTSLLHQLALRPEVAAISANPQTRLDFPVEFQSANELQARQNIEWGIRQIQADKVWALGYRGQGVVVGGQDTGYEWTHPAIKNRYRGWNGTVADHNYNWHDAIREISPLHRDTMPSAALNPCGLDAKAPCDDNSHGTHTMGTIIGGDDGAGNQIGVALEARWIAARNMERGYGSPATYIECFEWFLAPTDLNGRNPRPELAPHVINNSWSCPAMEGCNPTNWALMDRAINNLRAAGVVVVQSAGNSGPRCHSVADAAAIFEGAFSVGASRMNDTIATFSSRGSVIADGSGRLKPNVVAPGVNVRSAVRGGGYASWGGTSMAGPHVAGLVALIISANPRLAGQVETIETIIETTAKPMLTEESCGNRSGMEVPNNTYGYGRIDALAAVQRALALATDTDEATSVAAAEVFPNPAQESATFKLTGFSGEVIFRLTNSAGQQFQSARWEAQGVLLQSVNLQNLPAGVYFYQIIGKGAATTGRIIKN